MHKGLRDRTKKEINFIRIEHVDGDGVGYARHQLSVAIERDHEEACERVVTVRL